MISYIVLFFVFPKIVTFYLRIVMEMFQNIYYTEKVHAA